MSSHTRESLISELHSLYQSHDVVTRKKWEDLTGIPRSSYESIFGSFQAFKQAAGQEDKVVTKKLVSSIAKHAMRDHLTAFNEQKSGYEDKYLKPQGERFQTILTGSDIHDKLCDPFYRRLFIDTALRVQPAKIVLAGDIFDFPEFGKYTKDPRSFDVMGAINWVHAFLKDLRESAPNAEIVMVSGNHENRLLRYLSENSSSLLPILSDLHGFTVSSLLKLNDYEVNYISKDSLAVFNENDMKKELAKNYYIAYDSVLFHHFPYAKTYGMAGFNGHHHTHKVEQMYRVDRGPYEWTQLGCGHVRAASYCEAVKWSNGFALAHVDTQKKYVQTEYIDCTGEFCIIGGRWYQRSTGEIIVPS